MKKEYLKEYRKRYWNNELKKIKENNELKSVEVDAISNFIKDEVEGFPDADVYTDLYQEDRVFRFSVFRVARLEYSCVEWSTLRH